MKEIEKKVTRKQNEINRECENERKEDKSYYKEKERRNTHLWRSIRHVRKKKTLWREITNKAR